MDCAQMVFEEACAARGSCGSHCHATNAAAVAMPAAR